MISLAYVLESILSLIIAYLLYAKEHRTYLNICTKATEEEAAVKWALFQFPLPICFSGKG